MKLRSSIKGRTKLAAAGAVIVGFVVTLNSYQGVPIPVLLLLVSSLVASMATSPIAAAHFGRMTQYGLLANLLVVPVIGTLVMPGGVVAALLAPLVTKLPVSWFYPMGKDQELRVVRHPEYFLENDIIAGDFHYIKKFMPDKLPGKTIITNTVTAADRVMLQEAGIKMLITTTPCIQGRSFGTNVMEAMLVALHGGKEPLTADEYLKLLEHYHIESSVEYFGTKE